MPDQLENLKNILEAQITDQDRVVFAATDNIAATTAEEIKSGIANAGIVDEDYSERRLIGTVIATMVRDYVKANPDIASGFGKLLEQSVAIGAIGGLINQARDGVGER